MHQMRGLQARFTVLVGRGFFSLRKSNYKLLVTAGIILNNWLSVYIYILYYTHTHTVYMNI